MRNLVSLLLLSNHRAITTLPWVNQAVCNKVIEANLQKTNAQEMWMSWTNVSGSLQLSSVPCNFSLAHDHIPIQATTVTMATTATMVTTATTAITVTLPTTVNTSTTIWTPTKRSGAKGAMSTLMATTTFQGTTLMKALMLVIHKPEILPRMTGFRTAKTTPTKVVSPKLTTPPRNTTRVPLVEPMIMLVLVNMKVLGVTTTTPGIPKPPPPPSLQLQGCFFASHTRVSSFIPDLILPPENTISGVSMSLPFLSEYEDAQRHSTQQ